jgi:hypothetical protein
MAIPLALELPEEPLAPDEPLRPPLEPDPALDPEIAPPEEPEKVASVEPELELLELVELEPVEPEAVDEAELELDADAVEFGTSATRGALPHPAISAAVAANQIPRMLVPHRASCALPELIATARSAPVFAADERALLYLWCVPNLEGDLMQRRLLAALAAAELISCSGAGAMSSTCAAPAAKAANSGAPSAEVSEPQRIESLLHSATNVDVPQSAPGASPSEPSGATAEPAATPQPPRWSTPRSGTSSGAGTSPSCTGRRCGPTSTCTW